MVEWSVAGLLAAYFGIGVLALVLQHRSHSQAMTQLAALHEQHTADLQLMIVVLQTTIEMTQREVSHLRGELSVPP